MREKKFGVEKFWVKLKLGQIDFSSESINSILRNFVI